MSQMGGGGLEEVSKCDDWFDPRHRRDPHGPGDLKTNSHQVHHVRNGKGSHEGGANLRLYSERKVLG